MKLGQMKKCSDKRYYYRNVYLLSEHWKKLKKNKLKESPICEICGASKNLDVHHLRYKNLYDVELKDLQTLCRKHHTNEHKKLDKLKNKKSKKKQKDLKRRLIRRVSKITNLDKKIVNLFIK